MTKLKPCRRCGEVPKLDSDDKGWYIIVCESDHCMIHPDTGWYSDVQQCIAAWNNRRKPKRPAQSKEG